ncbi:PDDEXK nuclease domain-containing protein [Chitinophagaceae bacterium 26-R-25]|nr:PDDEXK nuclease domain-containing protein [Chitinophagaceae bacterium 26-R-25]
MKIDKNYAELINTLKQEIISSRYHAARLVNKEQLVLYLKTGKMLSEKVKGQKWGTKVLEQISLDLQKELPGLKGFSTSNLKKIRLFAEAYFDLLISSTPSNQFDRNSPNSEFSDAKFHSEELRSENFQLAFYGISFSHHFSILTKVKTWPARFFYIQSASANFWSLAVLEHHIENKLFTKEGKLQNNFDQALQDSLKPSAKRMFKDEYLLDFICNEEIEDERTLEQQVVLNIRNFILQMGKGFCFVGNQYRLEVDGDEFFIDLLFFNRHLQCLVAFELKKGKFKPADIGQLNFYLNVLDEKIKLPEENSSIGIVLCKEKNNTVVEFAIKSVDKAMGVATYKTSKQMPEEMKRILPDADQLANLF